MTFCSRPSPMAWQQTCRHMPDPSDHKALPILAARHSVTNHKRVQDMKTIGNITMLMLATAFALGMSSCGSAASSSGGAGIVIGTIPTPIPVATVNHWVATWCSLGGPTVVSTAQDITIGDAMLTVSITRAQIEAAMGPPTVTPSQQESWESGDWSFTAFYHSDGTLMQLDYNPTELSKGEQARLTCPESRKASS